MLQKSKNYYGVATTTFSTALIIIHTLVMFDQCYLISSFQPIISNHVSTPLFQSSSRLVSKTNYKQLPPSTEKSSSSTTLYGIDFDSVDEECDFQSYTDFANTNIDLSKCLPFPSTNYINGEDVVQLCMDALTYNDEPKVNAGLEVCFNFSSDKCRMGELIHCILIIILVSYILSFVVSLLIINLPICETIVVFYS